MAFQGALNCIRLEAIWTIHGQRVMNGFHVQRASSISDGDLVTALSDFENALRVGLKPEMSQEAVCVLLRAKDISTEFGHELERAPTSALAGDDVGQSLPNNVTVAVKWSTAYPGRNGRGRTYHIGLTAPMVEDSSMTPTSLTQLVNAYLYFRDTMEANGKKMVVISRIHDGIPWGDALVNVVTGVSIEATLDSQRRRLPGRGS